MFELPGDSDLVCNVVLRLASGLQVGKGMRQVDGTGPGSEETKRAPRKDTPPPAYLAQRSSYPQTSPSEITISLAPEPGTQASPDARQPHRKGQKVPDF